MKRIRLSFIEYGYWTTMAREKTEINTPTGSGWIEIKVEFACRKSTSEQPIKHQGKFFEERKIASGGFSTVYDLDVFKEKKQTQENEPPLEVISGKKVIKVTIFDDDPDIKKRQIEILENEAKCGQKTKHLGIKPPIIHEHWGALVMRKIKGQELYKILEKHLSGEQYLSITQLLALDESLLEALKSQIMDKDSLVHCDIKPENIIVDFEQNFETTIVDLGTGLILNEEVRRLRVGTRCYIAPEVLEYNLYSKAADVYSMGKVLALLSLKLFKKNEVIFEKHFNSTDLPPLKSERKFLMDFKALQFKEETSPYFLKALIEQMLQESPELRPDIDDLIIQFKKGKEDFLAQNSLKSNLAASSTEASTRRSPFSPSFFSELVSSQQEQNIEQTTIHNTAFI